MQNAVLMLSEPDQIAALAHPIRAKIMESLRSPDTAAGLARIARQLDLGPALVLGQGAENSGERERASVLAGLFEAVVAAAFLDGGLRAAETFILAAAANQLEAALPVDVLKAPKSRLQERAYANSGKAPSYRIVSSEGPDHDRRFVVEVSVDGSVLGAGEGRSRREAETGAAEAALEVLPVIPAADSAGAPA